MVKSKFLAIAASAALVAMLGLSACGGQAASSSASSASTASSSSTAASSSSTASSSSSSNSAAKTAALELVSWQGALTDGTLVDFISSDDGKNGGFVIEKPNAAEPERWLGAMTSTADGKVTITDDTSKESVSFTLTDVTEDGAVLIDVEGYGSGAIVPMTAADWQRVGEAEALAETLGTTVNYVGILKDGSLMVYIDNEDGSQAAVAIAPKGATSSSDLKTWMGKVTTDGSKQVTVTDDKTGEAINVTLTKVAKDGTLTVEVDGYGKGKLVEMTVADYLALEELLK